MELETEKFNTEPHTLHTKKSSYQQKVIFHPSDNTNEILFLFKRVGKNTSTIFLTLLFFPLILLSALDAYLDDISSNAGLRT